MDTFILSAQELWNNECLGDIRSNANLNSVIFQKQWKTATQVFLLNVDDLQHLDV